MKKAARCGGNDASDGPGGACTYIYLEVNTLLFLFSYSI